VFFLLFIKQIENFLNKQNEGEKLEKHS